MFKKKGKGFVPIEKVKELKEKNLPDVEVIQNLMNEGFSAEEIDQALTQFYTHTPKKEEKVEEKETFAPLFVKLEKYKQILTCLSETKEVIELIKNSLNTLKEVESLLSQNLKVLENTVQNFEKKFLKLDSYFLKPATYEEKEGSEAEDLEESIQQLTRQINELKSELESVAR